MIFDTPVWRNADLVRIIPITRGDLHQAIARCGFRPEYEPKPGKDRWYSWRDVVAVAAAQDLRKIGFGPAIAFSLVQNHLSPFLRDAIKTPDACDGVIWLVSLSGDHLSIAAWLWRADRDGSLSAFLNPDLSPAERSVAQVEGWILGVPGLIRSGEGRDASATPTACAPNVFRLH